MNDRTQHTSGESGITPGTPGRGRIIRKIFNNNIVNAIGHDGEEVILVGAGVGYLTRRGEPVDERRVEREFHLTGLAKGGTFRVLLEIPYPVLEAVSQVSQFLDRTHGVVLTPAVEVGLADHIAQAIARVDAGSPLYNPLLWETKMAYPAEFQMALESLDIIHRQLGRKLPLDEAGSVTMHLVNSGLVSDTSGAMVLGKALHEIVQIVESELGITIDGSTAGSTRFLTHVKFVIQRLTRDQVYDDALGELFERLRDDNAAVYACAVRIGDFLESTYSTRITAEEHMYLVLHILKLRAESTPSAPPQENP